MNQPNHLSAQEDSSPIHVWGYIKDGVKKTGSGFSVTKDDETGTYSVTFNSTFSKTPSVVASAVAGEKHYPRIAELDDLATTGFKVRIRNKGGELRDGNFCFVAVGV